MSLHLLAFIPFLSSMLTVNFFSCSFLSHLFLHYSCFSLSTYYFALSSFLFSHPLPNMKALFPPCLHPPFDQLCPSYFSFFFSGPWNGEAFPLFTGYMPSVLGILLSYLPICSKSCSKISVDSFSLFLYFSGCY